VRVKPAAPESKQKDRTRGNKADPGKAGGRTFVLFSHRKYGKIAMGIP
jgi:hypothetical protein